jgi:hypothetical protein
MYGSNRKGDREMKIETMRPLDKRIKRGYLMCVNEGSVYPIAQLRVSEREFWNIISIWIKEEFGIKVEFISPPGDEI